MARNHFKYDIQTFRSLREADRQSQEYAEKLAEEERRRLTLAMENKYYSMIRHQARRGMSRRRLIEIYGHGAVIDALDPPAPDWRRPDPEPAEEAAGMCP